MSIMDAAGGIVCYQGQRWNQDGAGVTYTEIREGSRDNLYAYMDSLEVNNTVLDGRKLVRTDLSQKEGSIWRLTLQYLAAEGTYDKDGTEYGKKTQRLTMRNIQLPLKVLKKYRTCWDHFLISCALSPSVPSWWESAENTYLAEAQAKLYRWVKSSESLPEVSYINGKPAPWYILKEPEKPGVETVDWAVYVITLTSKHSSAAKAGSVAADRANVIVSSPPYGNMGISGGDWKCCGAEVGFDGKFWTCTETYERSATDDGWDQDLYP